VERDDRLVRFITPRVRAESASGRFDVAAEMSRSRAICFTGRPFTMNSQTCFLPRRPASSDHLRSEALAAAEPEGLLPSRGAQP